MDKIRLDCCNLRTAGYSIVRLHQFSIKRFKLRATHTTKIILGEYGMLSSSSQWVLNPATFEAPDQLIETHLPEWSEVTAKFGFTFPKPSFYDNRRIIDDFSPNRDGQLFIVPFSQLDKYIQNGDVIIFMKRKVDLGSNLTEGNVTDLIKQRGWHGEIAYRDPDAFHCAPWGELHAIQEHHFEPTSDHNWNLHVFRIKPERDDELQIRALLGDGVKRWRRIFGTYRFPQTANGKAWFLDPVDFENISGLEQIAGKLIRREEVPPVYCMQWVHSILSLALNVPCNKETLTRLGLWDDYQRNWAPTLGFASDTLSTVGRLPINPYKPSDVICAACHLYLGVPQDFVRNLIIPKLSSVFPALQNEVNNLPTFTMPPIAPFMEYRKPEHRGEFEWEYVATALDDQFCSMKTT